MMTSPVPGRNTLNFPFGVLGAQGSIERRIARCCVPARHRVRPVQVQETGLAKGEPELLRSGFQDALHVPYRLPLIPGGEDAIAAAVQAGAWAGTVSGAGSGLLAVCAPADAARISDAMAASLAARHGRSDIVSFPLRAVASGVRSITWEEAGPPTMASEPRAAVAGRD